MKTNTTWAHFRVVRDSLKYWNWSSLVSILNENFVYRYIEYLKWTPLGQRRSTVTHFSETFFARCCLKILKAEGKDRISSFLQALAAVISADSSINLTVTEFRTCARSFKQKELGDNFIILLLKGSAWSLQRKLSENTLFSFPYAVNSLHERVCSIIKKKVTTNVHKMYYVFVHFQWIIALRYLLPSSKFALLFKNMKK